jgi:hypothetical protein
LNTFLGLPPDGLDDGPSSDRVLAADFLLETVLEEEDDDDVGASDVLRVARLVPLGLLVIGTAGTLKLATEE